MVIGWIISGSRGCEVEKFILRCLAAGPRSGCKQGHLKRLIGFGINLKGDRFGHASTSE